MPKLALMIWCRYAYNTLSLSFTLPSRSHAREKRPLKQITEGQRILHTVLPSDRTSKIENQFQFLTRA